MQLGDGRILTVRCAEPGDAAGVSALYSRLALGDLEARFFSCRRPPELVIEAWVSIADRGGLTLVAEIDDEDGHGPLIVAEAGYALLPNGDGELGITVDPDWRGWLAPWLLDALVGEAAANGVANLEAEVLVRNRKMVTLLRHRGEAVVDRPDWQHVRLVISTTGRTPSWPQRSEGHRLLVAEPRGRWPGQRDAERHGLEVRTCPGPDGPRPHCPALEGRPCPLVEGADAIVFALPGDDPRSDQILAELRRRHPERTIVMADAERERHPCDAAGAVLDRVLASLSDGDP
ncbi:MAG: hypothetical protein AAFZ07_01775 [Actinomycetota bacterium]